MFDWFWDFLYSISKSIFYLIDCLMRCANILCGIDPVKVEGEDKDFMTYLLSSDRVTLAFKVAAVAGIVLVAIFGVFAILRSIVSEKANTTPMRVFGNAFKTVLMFAFVPVCIIVFVHFTNAFMNGLYKATLGGGSNGLGNFMCGAFSSNGLRSGVSPDFYTYEGFDYYNSEIVRMYVDLSDFDFFFSWVAGVCILIELGKALLNFVDRAISIVFLFIVSPISMSTSVIDDGAHFKLWRDQVFVKFLSGYGCIIALNIYMIIVSMISNDNVIFFPESSTLNNVMKIAFIVGGAISMQRVMALAGNLISAGAGTNEMRENQMAAEGFKKAVGTMAGIAAAPFKAARGISNFARDASNLGMGAAIGKRLGFRTDHDYGIKSEKERANELANKKKEHEQLANLIGTKVAEAIGGKPAAGGNANANQTAGDDNKNPNGTGNKNDAIQNAIMMSFDDKKNAGGNKKK